MTKRVWGSLGLIIKCGLILASTSSAIAQTTPKELYDKNPNPYEILLLPPNRLDLTDVEVREAYLKQIENLDWDTQSEFGDQIIDAYREIQHLDNRLEFAKANQELKAALDIIPLTESIRVYDYTREVWLYSLLDPKDETFKVYLDKVVLNNPLRKIWNAIDHDRRAYFLKWARGKKLELAVLNLIVGRDPTDSIARMEIRELLLNRFSNSREFSHFLYYLVKAALNSVDPNPLEIERQGRRRLTELRKEAVEFLVWILVDQNDYWSRVTLLDLEFDIRLQFWGNKHDVGTKTVLRALNANVENFGGRRSLEFRRALRFISTLPIRTLYKATCGVLLQSDYSLKKAPL